MKNSKKLVDLFQVNSQTARLKVDRLRKRKNVKIKDMIAFVVYVLTISKVDGRILIRVL
jgi:hypothetical protein